MIFTSHVKSIAQVALLLILMISAPFAARAQTQSELALPSLSIFGFPLPLSPENEKFDHPFTAQELEGFLAEVNEFRPNQNTAETQRKKETSYFVVPFVFYRSRHLFRPQVWTESDVKEGQLISHFFARLVERPELEIKATDQRSFGRGLQKLRDWFSDLTQDNETLSAMIFTMDDGPFLGQQVDERRFNSWKRLQSAPIPGTRAKFVLMTDNKAPEPMIIGVMNADNSLLWARRYTTEVGHISDATLGKSSARQLEGYGFIVGMAAGGESSRVYLDKKLALRFYFVSW